MNRRFLIAGFVGIAVISGASIYAAAELSVPGNGTVVFEPGPVTEQQIRAKLAAAGFSNIQVTPRNVFDVAGTRDGRSMQLAIDPLSGKVVIAGSDDDNDGD
jgi:hypothetical protein